MFPPHSTLGRNFPIRLSLRSSISTFPAFDGGLLDEAADWHLEIKKSRRNQAYTFPGKIKCRSRGKGKNELWRHDGTTNALNQTFLRRHKCDFSTHDNIVDHHPSRGGRFRINTAWQCCQAALTKNQPICQTICPLISKAPNDGVVSEYDVISSAELKHSS